MRGITKTCSICCREKTLTRWVGSRCEYCYIKSDPSRFHRKLKSLTKPAVMLKNLMRWSKRRGLECTLTVDHLTDVKSKPCHYCGGTLAEYGYGIDRKDNKVGYTPENSLPCCKPCNSIKGQYLTMSEMEAAMAAVTELRRRAV